MNYLKSAGYWVILKHLTIQKLQWHFLAPFLSNQVWLLGILNYIKPVPPTTSRSECLPLLDASSIAFRWLLVHI